MPVEFPPGWPRTALADRERGRFTKSRTVTSEWSDATRMRHQPISFSDSLRDVQSEVTRAGGTDLRIDHGGDYDRRSGAPLAGRREPDDPGVVVYWKRAGKGYVLACDKYEDRAQNLRAIAKTIEATRGIERWGVVSGEMAFKGYEALPPPGSTASTSRPRRAPHEVLHIAPDAPRDVVLAAFRARAKDLHPDAGGSHEDFTELVAARDELLARRLG